MRQQQSSMLERRPAESPSGAWPGAVKARIERHGLSASREEASSALPVAASARASSAGLSAEKCARLEAPGIGARRYVERPGGHHAGEGVATTGALVESASNPQAAPDRAGRGLAAALMALAAGCETVVCPAS
jgi:hypothetical protein